MEIDRDGLYRNGVVSLGMGGRCRGSPGSANAVGSLHRRRSTREGYDYVVSIEHEEWAFEGNEELATRGFLIARDALRH
jgi:hypothetical protein